MKEQVIPLLLSIVSTLLNYIFISTISAKSQQQVINDFKQVLTYMLEEIKSEQQIIKDSILKTNNDVMNQIKESTKQSQN